MAIENLVASIVAEYNNYLQQLTLYDNLAYAVTLSRERVRIDEQRYLLGSASRMQLLQSIVYLNADSSRYARQNEVLRASQIRLNELMANDDPGEAFLLEDERISVDTTLDYDALLALALENNTSLQIASKNRVISEMDYKIIRSGTFPYLEFTSGYGYNYNGYSASNLPNQHMHGLNYGLTLGMDIFDGFNRNREQSNARIGIESSQIRFEEVEQSVKADLLTIYYAYENNLRLMRLEEQNLKVAQENLEIALERYKLGSLAGLELREVQKSLLDAEERLISVKYQIKLAEITLYQLAGGIMNYL
jgi:outer membrane protein TolC